MRSQLSVLCISLLLLASCSSKDNEQAGQVTTIPSSAITDRSIYNLESLWKDQHGKTVRLPELAGKPRIVAMFYSSCDYACPKTIADMKSLLNSLPESSQKQVGMTLFSFDPDRDTPARLDSVAEDMDLREDQWQILTGSAAGAEELGAVLNVQYKGQADGEFSHSNVILLLDRAGEVVHRQEGVSADPTASLEVLRKLLGLK